MPKRTQNAISQGQAVSRRAAGGRAALVPVDIITAGVPCQDVSVAGKRAGLRGKCTGLFYEFARILRELRPAWFVFENVPGLLSSNGGRDFAEVLRVLMVECGYGVCWRVLDSRFFGVAQRRRRVFIVGRFGKPCPPEVLFESASGAGHPTPSGEARADVAFALAASVRGTGDGHGQGWNSNYIAGTLGSQNRKGGGGWMPNCEQAADGYLVADPITASYGKQPDSSDRNAGPPTVIVTALRHLGSGGPDDNEAQGGHIVIQDARGQREKRQHGIGIQQGGPSYTLDGTSQHAVAYTLRSQDGHGGGNKYGYAGDNLIHSASPDADGVRSPARLSEGLDDPFALLPEGLDSARYRALGNAVTVSVAEWIARRIRAVMEP